jgi:hypothetical protein
MLPIWIRRRVILCSNRHIVRLTSPIDTYVLSLYYLFQSSLVFIRRHVREYPFRMHGIRCFRARNEQGPLRASVQLRRAGCICPVCYPNQTRKSLFYDNRSRRVYVSIGATEIINANRVEETGNPVRVLPKPRAPSNCRICKKKYGTIILLNVKKFSLYALVRQALCSHAVGKLIDGVIYHKTLVEHLEYHRVLNVITNLVSRIL